MIPFAVEKIDLFVGADPCEPAPSEARVTVENFLYWSFTHSGFRRPRSHQVVVVKLVLSELPAPIFQNLCEQRRFLAALVDNLNESGPSLIVIDKYFSPDGCPNEQANSELLRAFATASKQTPIIIGSRTFTESEWALHHGTVTQEDKRRFGSACLVLAPAIDFAGLTKSDQIFSGLIRLNFDVRKIPLEWLTYPADFLGQATPIPSLAFAAAQVRDPELVNTKTIQQYVAGRHHPLTSFLEPHAIPELSAADLMCNTPAADQIHLKGCKKIDQKLRRVLKGRVVVIGDDSEADRHPTGTPLGKVPGVLLQANYIESLLDDRYFRPMPNSFVLGAAIFWVLLIEVLFSQMKSPEVAVALWVVLVCVSLGVCWVVLAAIGTLTFGGVAGTPLLVLSKYADAYKDRLKK